MESIYDVKFRIGKFFIATWNPEIAHQKGWFIGIEYHRYFHPIFSYSKPLD